MAQINKLILNHTEVYPITVSDAVICGENSLTGALEAKANTSAIPTTAQQVGAEPATVINTITGEAVTLEAVGGNSYLCGVLTTLTLTAENSEREAVIRFSSGATATTLTLPVSLKRCGYWGVSANRSYEISIANNLAVLVDYE